MAVRKKPQTPGFEEAIAELETLVSAMEQGDISLEKSLEYFQRGVELTRTCQKALQDAEQKVKILSAKQPVEGEDFAPDADE